MNWRTQASEVIRGVINDNPTAPLPELRKLISAAYPWGERRNHPYKIWLSEVKSQLTQHELLKFASSQCANRPQIEITDGLFDGN